MSEIQKNQLPCNLQTCDTVAGGIERLSRELDETLLLGFRMPAGALYLFFYYGQLAITTEDGMANWPKGPRDMIGIISVRERRLGIPPARKKRLLYIAWHIIHTMHEKAA